MEKRGSGMEEEEGKSMSRKEKRKAMKKMKRKQARKEAAERERQEEEEHLNDPEEQRRMQLLERQEADRMQRDMILFQEREKAWLDMLIIRKQQEQLQHQQEENEEYKCVEEEGPPEIIWQGNEIIFKKKQLKVRITNGSKPKPNNIDQNDHQHEGEDPRPISNPLPPEFGSESHTHTLHSVAHQIPNFGTEQDKAHCPFHLKTGACRFGMRCSRVHFYPDKSCTLLIKNMYNGPGLACDRDQDEGLEYTDEEVESYFEEFYEDVHTEFLKFGEIVNFKVCKNGSFHLRGNVYVQYKSLDSALLAFSSVNGRYFAAKQVTCQFVNLTRWKIAICGEYMKSGFKTCSHGTACNFIHCFRNPGGDYEWADSDKPPPKYWVKKMVALFGYSDNYETLREQGNLSLSKTDSDRYHSRRSRSKEIDQLNCGNSGRRRHEDERKRRTPDEDQNANFKNKNTRKFRDKTTDTDSDGEWLEREENGERHIYIRNRDNNSRSHDEDSDVDWDTRHNRKQLCREGRNSSRVRIYEAVSYGDRDEKRNHISKSSIHQSGDASESAKDLLGGEMETQHDYCRKSLRHRTSGLQDDCRYYEKDKVDGNWSRWESHMGEHHHKRKRS